MPNDSGRIERVDPNQALQTEEPKGNPAIESSQELPSGSRTGSFGPSSSPRPTLKADAVAKLNELAGAYDAALYTRASLDASLVPLETVSSRVYKTFLGKCQSDAYRRSVEALVLETEPHEEFTAPEQVADLRNNGSTLLEQSVAEVGKRFDALATKNDIVWLRFKMLHETICSFGSEVESMDRGQYVVNRLTAIVNLCLDKNLLGLSAQALCNIVHKTDPDSTNPTTQPGEIGKSLIEYVVMEKLRERIVASLTEMEGKMTAAKREMIETVKKALRESNVEVGALKISVSDDLKVWTFDGSVKTAQDKENLEKCAQALGLTYSLKLNVQSPG